MTNDKQPDVREAVELDKSRRYLIMYNDDGEFGQVTGWLYSLADDTYADGSPAYVWSKLPMTVESVSPVTGMTPTQQRIHDLVCQAETDKAVIEQLQAALQGWKLVPVEPTAEMIAEAISEYVGDVDALEAYRSMLAAAPTYPNKDDGIPERMWQSLFWDLAKELKCLPSSFVDANEHVFNKARKLIALSGEFGISYGSQKPTIFHDREASDEDLAASPQPPQQQEQSGEAIRMVPSVPNEFVRWFYSADHRKKYTTDAPAFLAAWEAWRDRTSPPSPESQAAPQPLQEGEKVAVAECYDNGTPEGGVRWLPYTWLNHKIKFGDKFYTAPHPGAQDDSELVELRNVYSVKQHGDFLVTLSFESCRSASAFCNAVNSHIAKKAK